LVQARYRPFHRPPDGVPLEERTVRPGRFDGGPDFRPLGLCSVSHWRSQIRETT